ncbi:asparagine synthase-related protein [Cohnella faecalis]|nr:asparagine synthase-related protein [Cohnella faecalis]
MSAIFGQYSLPREPLNQEDLQIMLQTYKSKYEYDRLQIRETKGVGLGCLLQCVTLESRQEELPFRDSESNVWITADAILDNREELVRLLGLLPGEGEIVTDSRLILASYLKWGDRCAERLNGIFAFAIFDGRNDEMLLVRDQRGMRSLAYTIRQSTLYFASTVAPIAKVAPSRYSKQWLQNYLTAPFVAPDTDEYRSIYEGIRYLPPAHIMKVKDGKAAFRPYWTLERPFELSLASDEDYEERFRSLLEEATKASLRTDSSVGILLSGGLDSTTVAAVAAPMLEREGRRLHSYTHVPISTFKHNGKELVNERPLVEELIDMYPSISPTWVENEALHAFNVIDDWVDILDQPFSFFGNAPWMLSCYEQAAKKGHRVMLNGKNGNGSISFGPLNAHYSYLRKHGRWLELARETWHQKRLRDISWLRAMRIVAGNALSHRGSSKLIAEVRAGLSLVFSPVILEHSTWNDMQNKKDSPFDLMLQLSAPHKTHHQGVIHTLLSLKYNIVTRDPTGYVPLLSFLASLPFEQFVSKGVHKRLLRRAYSDKLPASILNLTRDKGIQSADWLHRIEHEHDSILSAFMECIGDSNIRTSLNQSIMQSGTDQLRSLLRQWYPASSIFRCITIERYMRHGFKGGEQR